MPPYPVNSCVRPTTGVQPAFTPVADFVYVARCTGVTLSVWAWHAWLRHEYCTLRVSARRPLSDSILDRRDSDARRLHPIYTVLRVRRAPVAVGACPSPAKPTGSSDNQGASIILLRSNVYAGRTTSHCTVYMLFLEKRSAPCFY
jgi:hypothetical protein